MARELTHIRKQMAVAVVDGRKRLVLSGRTIQTKSEVQARIAALDEQIATVLPEAKARVDGAGLKAAAEKRIDAQIAALQDRKSKLDAAALAADAQAAVDRKIARLADVRAALAEQVEQIE